MKNVLLGTLGAAVVVGIPSYLFAAPGYMTIGNEESLSQSFIADFNGDGIEDEIRAYENEGHSYFAFFDGVTGEQGRTNITSLVGFGQTSENYDTQIVDIDGRLELKLTPEEGKSGIRYSVNPEDGSLNRTYFRA